MHIKRFEAWTMSEALRMVKEALGPDAVILSVRQHRGGGVLGFLKKPAVEITAAAEPVPAAAPRPVQPRRSAAPLYANRPERRRRESSPPSNPVYRMESWRTESRRPESRQPESRGEVDPGLHAVSDLHRRLAAHEVNDALAWDLVGAVARELGGKSAAPLQMADMLVRVLRTRGVRLGPEAAPDGGGGQTFPGLSPETVGAGIPQVVALVGATGVGKTTTAAKLAARLLRQGRRPALVTMDQERIGGVEQLRIFARAMELPFASVARPGDLPVALERLETPDLILDTPGTAPGDAEGLARLGDAIHRVPGGRATLLLPASARDRDIDFALERFGALPLSRIIVTKIDEAAVLGALFHLALRAPVPVAFFSEGPRVPEDLQPADVAGLVHRLCGSAPAKVRPDSSRRSGREGTRAGTKRPGAESGFVANRHSDRFHQPGCPAARQIRPENRREFASAAEAEAAGCLPCKRCVGERTETEEPAPTSCRAAR
ncbi:MAG: Ada metal-binding domain-containing protein [Desulfococcaceae bacterium]